MNQLMLIFLRVIPGVKIRIEVPVNLLIMKNHQD